MIIKLSSLLYKFLAEYKNILLGKPVCSGNYLAPRTNHKESPFYPYYATNHEHGPNLMVTDEIKNPHIYVDLINFFEIKTFGLISRGKKNLGKVYQSLKLKVNYI